MEKQTGRAIKIWFRAIGFTCLIASCLMLLYEALLFFKDGVWTSFGLIGVAERLGWDDIYFLPSAENWPRLHDTLVAVFSIPVWALGTIVWAIIRLLVGPEEK